MIRDRLIEQLGEDPQFTMEMATKMKAQMDEDLGEGKKLEYRSAAGLTVLFDTSGGKVTTEMEEYCQKADSDSKHAKNLFKEVRQIWDEWDIEDDKQNDDQLMFCTFYNGFMAPHFGCFMQAINMDNDGYIDWKEFLFYLKRAMHQYPNIKDVDELLRKTFTMRIIPAMRDEVLGLNGEASQGKNEQHTAIDLANFFIFSYQFRLITQTSGGSVPDTKTIPVGLRKMQEQGLINPIIEIDLATESIDWEKFTTEDVCQLLTERFKWSRAYLSPDAKILVNLRDFPDAMVYEMERLFTVVDYLASRPAAERPFAIMFEEPTGKFLPEEVGAWTAGKPGS
ncbi:hypothetical protein AWC38_SpisGene22754 [Stylophora pistillata]|uniref:EF-hand domain-containing protein n=1 Tax=Stylophora pistillata TaxID=50429 RepID=A0A2B4R7P8_STYPI|nr:hypothetical protein AWC38_SpisGene22754 [Stylophora pistillata]